MDQEKLLQIKKSFEWLRIKRSDETTLTRFIHSKICVDKNENINEFGKVIPNKHDYDFYGESVGFFKFDNYIGNELVSIIDDYIAKEENEMPYEEVIRNSVLKSPEKFGSFVSSYFIR